MTLTLGMPTGHRPPRELNGFERALQVLQWAEQSSERLKVLSRCLREGAEPPNVAAQDERLTQELIHSIKRAMIALNLHNREAARLGGLDPQIVARIQRQMVPADQLLAELHYFNEHHRGSLLAYLGNGLRDAEECGSPNAEVFRRALRFLTTRPTLPEVPVLHFINVDGPSGPRTMCLLQDGRSAREVEALPGYVFGFANRLWRWSVRPVTYRHLSLSKLGEWLEILNEGDLDAEVQHTDDDLVTASTTISCLVSDEGETVTLAGADLDGGVITEPNFFGGFASPLGCTGRWLFVQSQDMGYMGGAHHHWSNGFDCIDLSSGTKAPLLDLVHRELEQELPGYGARAWAENPSSYFDGDEAPHHELTALRVRLVQTFGTIEVDGQFTREECFAGSDGNWDAYTASVWLKLDRVPLVLATCEHLPPQVRSAMSLLKEDEHLVGWSSVEQTPEMAARFERFAARIHATASEARVATDWGQFDGL